MTKLSQPVNLLLFFTLSFAGLYFAAEYLIPLTLAAVLAMLFVRLCNLIESKGVARGYASFYCILLFVLAIGIIITLLSIQLGSLSENLSGMEKRLVAMFESLKQWINETIGLKKAAQENEK